MLAVSAVLARVDDGIATALGASGWRPSTQTWDAFAALGDGAGAHLAYVVATPKTRAVEGLRQPREIIPVKTDLRVRWLHRLRAGARREDYREALDAETVLLQTILAISRAPELRIVVASDGIERRELAASSGGYLLGEIAAIVSHEINPGGYNGGT
jgi:hypothetical protein